MTGSTPRPSGPHPAIDRPDGRRSLWLVIAVLVSWNVLADRLPAAQLPIAVAGVAAVVVVARRSGLGWEDLGLARDRLRTGLRVGAIAASAVLLIVLVVTAIPTTRGLLADGRFVGVEGARLAYEILVRIPLAVAAAEEIAFRGALFGMLAAQSTPRRAIWMSSALFGLWHVLPGISALDTTSAAGAGSGMVEVGLVAGQVVVTGLAGVAFAWLRLRGRHVVAPILAHAALNTGAFTAGWLIVQNGWA